MTGGGGGRFPSCVFPACQEGSEFLLAHAPLITARLKIEAIPSSAFEEKRQGKFSNGLNALRYIY
jgi:hypothetical protein